MKKYLLVLVSILWGGVASTARIVGNFGYAQNNRLYFYLHNNTNDHLIIRGVVYSPLRQAENSETISMAPGDIFYLGPTTPWRWQWCKGDVYTIIYTNGYKQSWICPIDDYYNNQSFRGNISFKKTNAKCKKCGCSGYHGYYHNNGTYEGACQNTDGWGHTCGHTPSQHGLREW